MVLVRGWVTQKLSLFDISPLNGKTLKTAPFVHLATSGLGRRENTRLIDWAAILTENDGNQWR